MKLLITGSSGNVGFILSKYFSQKGIRVVGLDIVKNPIWEGNNNFTFYKADVTGIDELRKIFSKENPTHILHLAYLMKPLHNVIKEYVIDVGGSKNVIIVSNETTSVKQFIQFSSTSAYGGWPDNRLWIKETDPLRPGDYRYGINKKKIEEYINTFNGRKDLKFVIVRLCTIIGPSEYKKGGLVRLIANSPFLIMYGSRHCDVQFIHEDDLTSLIDLIIKDKDIEGTFNLVPDSYSTVKDLVPDKKFLNLPLQCMKALTGLLWFLRIARMRPPAIQLSAYGIVADAEKLKKRYNYTFKYTTLTGFRQVVEEMKKQGKL
jgi:nucleoside-diphosphate-sugar epimerase